MPTLARLTRARRVRKRAASFTPAELQWLTGEPQPDANPFEALALDLPHAGELDRLDTLLDRAEAAEWIAPARIETLRRALARRRRTSPPRHPQ